MAQSIDESIIEGFICPICMVSFRAADVLRAHFEVEHKTTNSATGIADSSEADICKRRLLRDLSNFAFYNRSGVHQPFGQCRSRTTSLEKLRKFRINRDSLETNSLLIRLEKLVSAPSMSKAELKEFERGVVPWIGEEVGLCPSCGSNFGLSIEEAFPDSEGARNVSNGLQKFSLGHISKLKLTQITNALLDYNPVFRRRHHCRLCGHVVCADCSHYLLKHTAVKFLQLVEEFNLGQSNKTSSNAVLRDIFSLDSQRSGTSASTVNDSSLVSPVDYSPPINYHWRICYVCKELLERKLRRMRTSDEIPYAFQAHSKLKYHMNKVIESMPVYAAMAESLHSGEQRYALDLAKTMRHDLLEALQQIDSIRRSLESSAAQKPNSESKPISTNAAYNRLIRNVCSTAREFIQTNVPPLKALPTFRQYDTLTAQRQDDMAARWAEEDKALAQLEKRVENETMHRPLCITADHMRPTEVQIRSNLRRTTKVDQLEDLRQLAICIDDISQLILQANSAKDYHRATMLVAQLNSLETKFKSMSSSLQLQ